jgi:outer membrane lipoprotein-sorting protein
MKKALYLALLLSIGSHWAIADPVKSKPAESITAEPITAEPITAEQVKSERPDKTGTNLNTPSDSPVEIPAKAKPLGAAALVDLIDQYRGLAGQGFSFDITNISYKKGRDARTNELSVDVQDDKSLVKFRSPARQRGRVLLKQDNDMWLYIPGTRKVIRISPAQRLLGEASNGDVAGTNYATDYTANITTTAQDKKDGQIQLTLNAKTRKISYTKVVFWLNDNEHHQPVRSEYYARSGKLLKTAHYKEFKSYHGQPKIHKMLLVDPVIKGNYTWMKFDNYRASDLPPALFSKEAIVNL